MPSSDYLEHLAQIRLFSSCNNKELAKIAKASDELSLAQGKVLMTQGQAGREAFVIVDGEATVDVGDTEVAELGPGAPRRRAGAARRRTAHGHRHGQDRHDRARHQPAGVLRSARRGARPGPQDPGVARRHGPRARRAARAPRLPDARREPAAEFRRRAATRYVRGHDCDRHRGSGRHRGTTARAFKPRHIALVIGFGVRHCSPRCRTRPS